MTNSQKFYSLLFAFILGNFFYSFLPFFLVLFLFSIFLLYVLRKNILFFFAFFGFFLFGFFYTKHYFHKVQDNFLSSFYDQKVKIEGVIVSEGEKTPFGFKYYFQPLNVKEKILIYTRAQPLFRFGDQLEIKGRLKKPLSFEIANYEYLLAKEGVYGIIFFPAINFRSSGKAFFISQKIFELKEKLKEIIEKSFVSFKRSLLAALLLGEKQEMPNELKEKLNRSGLRHITAISGMHITIIGWIFVSFFNFLNVSRRNSLLLSLVFIFFFIGLTGFSASAVRAGIMISFYFLALYFGRLPISYRPLCLAGFLMLFQNPFLLKFDLGFQLSFLAMIGIISFSQFFQQEMKSIPNFSFLPLRQIISLTISAQIFTLPLQVFNFGYFSLSGILSNLLVLPFLSILIVLGFLFLFFSLFSKIIASPFYFPLFFLLEMLEKTINFFSQLPFAVFYLQLSTILLFIIYCLLIIFAFKVQKQTSLPYFLKD